MGRECDESLIWTLTNTRGYTDKSDTIRERSYKAFERCEKAVNKDREVSSTMAKVLLKFPIAILAILLANGAMQALAKCRYTSDYNDFDGDGDSDGGDLTCLYPWSKDGNDLPAEPRTSFYSDLNNCLRVLSNKCSRQNYNYIFHKKKISKDCCRKLVEMGRECDESLIWTLSNTRAYTDKSDTIRGRSYKAFERCEKAVNGDRGW
ncbi:hypothetical protein RJ639_044468 [Escallonia herrerae]|uniref:Prolamin-like domain-containing protein n=1 Tax=Escallonia herrerae TaxID=1293975 RepID=A0AA89B052_9ASTE|nr:hypothetical protein RJ639_044468 [Escallonia herrerae]